MKIYFCTNSGVNQAEAENYYEEFLSFHNVSTTTQGAEPHDMPRAPHGGEACKLKLLEASQ